jgi:hypothetical protein
MRVLTRRVYIGIREKRVDDWRVKEVDREHGHRGWLLLPDQAGRHRIAVHRLDRTRVHESVLLGGEPKDGTQEEADPRDLRQPSLGH